MPAKPQIQVSEVHKAQALARHHAGQAARAQGFDRSALLALATYGKPTIIQMTGDSEGVPEPLTLLPQTLQVQLALIEHAKIFPVSADATVADGIERLTHLALIYSDPSASFEILTQDAEPEVIRHDFRRAAFDLAAVFADAKAIDQLTAHIAVQMRLTDEAAGGDLAKKPQPPAAQARGKQERRPPHRRS